MTVIIVLMLMAFTVGFTSLMVYTRNETRREINQFAKLEVQLDKNTKRNIKNVQALDKHLKELGTYDHAKPIKDPIPMKEAIELALPKTPTGCFWSVKKIKEEWWEGWVDAAITVKPKKLTSDSKVMFKKEWRVIEPTDERWFSLPESGKEYKLWLEIEFHSPDSEMIQIKILIDKNASNDQFVTNLTTRIRQQCNKVVEQYILKIESWDGVYIKNEE